MNAEIYQLWRDVNDVARRRPALLCRGCGYHRPVMGEHRDDCTEPAVLQERRRAVIRRRLAEIDAWRAEQTTDERQEQNA